MGTNNRPKVKSVKLNLLAGHIAEVINGSPQKVLHFLSDSYCDVSNRTLGNKDCRKIVVMINTNGDLRMVRADRRGSAEAQLYTAKFYKDPSLESLYLKRFKSLMIKYPFMQAGRVGGNGKKKHSREKSVRRVSNSRSFH